MNGIKVVDALVEAGRDATRIEVRVMQDGLARRVRRAAATAGEAAGLDLRALEHTLREVAADELILAVEDALLKELRLRRLQAGRVAGAVDKERVLAEAARVLDHITPADRMSLSETAIHLAQTSKKTTRDAFIQSVLRNMTGEMREVVAKTLEPVMESVRRVHAQLGAEIGGGVGLSVLDTTAPGAVELPTRLHGDNRFIVAGTDRLVGIGTFAPVRVEYTFKDGVTESLRVAGEFDVRLAVEVKPASKTAQGVVQLRALALRAEQQYAVIDGNLWLLKYDPATVEHVLVAPAGTALERASAVPRIKTVALSKAQDKAVIDVAKTHLGAAWDLLGR